MTRFSWPIRTMCLAILILGIGCGGKTHIVGSVADGSVGGGLGGTASGSGGLPGQDGPAGLGGATSTSSRIATGGSPSGGGAGGTMPKDGPVATGGARGTGGATGRGGAISGNGGLSGGSAGSPGRGGVSGGSSGRGGQTGGSAGSSGSGGAGGVGGTAGSTGSSADGGWDGGVNECEQRGGECQSVPLTADTYARCATLSGTPCMLPAPAYDGALGCATSADGVIPICCLPQWEQPSGQCAASGTMACYPQIAGLPSDRYEEMCPMGWSISNATCDQPGTDCCGPPDKQMVCPPWP